MGDKLGVKLLILTKCFHKQSRQHSGIRIALYEVTCLRLKNNIVRRSMNTFEEEGK